VSRDDSVDFGTRCPALLNPASPRAPSPPPHPSARSDPPRSIESDLPRESLCPADNRRSRSSPDRDVRGWRDNRRRNRQWTKVCRCTIRGVSYDSGLHRNRAQLIANAMGPCRPLTPSPSSPAHGRSCPPRPAPCSSAHGPPAFSKRGYSRSAIRCCAYAYRARVPTR
jgi:hypothetical protein